MAAWLPVLALVAAAWLLFVVVVARFCGFNERRADARGRPSIAERFLAPSRPQTVKGWNDTLEQDRRARYYDATSPDRFTGATVHHISDARRRVA